MELKATAVGQHLAQHPYNRACLLPAGIEVSGSKHSYIIPFNQLLTVQCKKGLIWGELEFELPGKKVVRLHGTEWQETQLFYRQLMQNWQRWDQEVSPIAAEVLHHQIEQAEQLERQGWIKRCDLERFQDEIKTALQSLPLPEVRLSDFADCVVGYNTCLQWLTCGEMLRQQANQRYIDYMLADYPDLFFATKTQKLDRSQSEAVISDEKTALILANAGTGKTSVLIAKVNWLLLRQQIQPQQILLLTMSYCAAQQLNEHLDNSAVTGVQAKSFHEWTQDIIEQAGRRRPLISELESDDQARQMLLLNAWQQQCEEKKAYAKSWKQLLSEEFGWSWQEALFWHDPLIMKPVARHLDRWLELMRKHGGKQAQILASVGDEQYGRMQKYLRLMAPLLKAWKQALKQQGATDSYGLLLQAIDIIHKKRLISPWRHLLIDGWEDVTPLQIQLLRNLRQQNNKISLFATVDTWQAIKPFDDLSSDLTTIFEQNFGPGDYWKLETCYRLDQRISDIAHQFIQQRPMKLANYPPSQRKGDKNSLILLPMAELEKLLDKLSGLIMPNQRILFLTRYQDGYPVCLLRAATRWPKLPLEFMTIHDSKGQEADHVIIFGLDSGIEGFPAPFNITMFEQILAPKVENISAAKEQEKRLLYLALTRAKQQVWGVYDPQSPSVFIKQLTDFGAIVRKRF